jgi:hypothetical protein
MYIYFTYAEHIACYMYECNLDTYTLSRVCMTVILSHASPLNRYYRVEMENIHNNNFDELCVEFFTICLCMPGALVMIFAAGAAHPVEFIQNFTPDRMSECWCFSRRHKTKHKG